MKTNFSFLIVLVLVAFSLKAQTVFQNVVAHYPLNGNANDLGPFSFNGTVSGATLTEDRFGNANSAYFFDGTDDFIVTSTEIDDSLYNGASFSAWINISEPHTGRILSNYNGQGMPGDCESRIGFVFGVNSNLELLLFYAIDGNDYVGRKTDAGSLSANTWHHVVGIWERTFNNGAFQLFIDGVRKDTQDCEDGTVDCGGYLESSNPFHIGIGHCSTGPCGPFLGEIDNVRIFDAPVDSVTVNQLYNEPSLAIPHLFGSNAVRCYPNPASDFLTLTIDQTMLQHATNIQIVDVFSRVVLAQQINCSQFQLYLKDRVEPGMYTLRLIDPQDCILFTKKILVQ